MIKLMTCMAAQSEQQKTSVGGRHIARASVALEADVKETVAPTLGYCSL